jgi:hypothetical protein
MWYTFDPEPPGDDCPDHGPHTGDCPKCEIDETVVIERAADETGTCEE